MKQPADLSLYLVAGPADCASGDIIATVREAVAGGVTIVQLRDKTASDEEFTALGRKLKAELEGTGVPLVINDRVHLVRNHRRARHSCRRQRHARPRGAPYRW
jgi:thiamine-phosphate pyrophosphorylase